MTIKKKAGANQSRRSGKGKGKGPGRKPRYATLPPKEPQRIALQAAIELTQRYRRSAPASEHGGFFWADGLKEIFAQPDCVGLRYYHGLDADGSYQIVLVGVNSKGEDITQPANRPKPSRSAKVALAAAPSAGEAVLLDRHWPCPPMCDPSSPLL
jgi:hypothetical protein